MKYSQNCLVLNFFSILDCSSSFWMVPLDKPSSDLCVFGTPFGRYKFLRLPFGLNLSSKVFQRIISSIFDIEGVEPYIADIVVHGKTIEEHDRRLEQVLKVATEYNIKFNSEKCVFNTKEVKFLGHIIDKEGIHIDNKKVEAVLKLSPPSDRKELERFMGTVNYLSKFIPNFSSKTSGIRDLLNKNNMWLWDTNHNRCFEDLKNVFLKHLY